MSPVFAMASLAALEAVVHLWSKRAAVRDGIGASASSGAATASIAALRVAAILGVVRIADGGEYEALAAYIVTAGAVTMAAQITFGRGRPPSRIKSRSRNGAKP